MITTKRDLKKKDIIREKEEIPFEAFKNFFISKKIPINNTFTSVKSILKESCKVSKQRVTWSVLILIFGIVTIFVIDLIVYIFGSLFLVKWVPQNNRLIITLSINLEIILVVFMVFFCVVFNIAYSIKKFGKKFWDTLINITGLVSFGIFLIILLFIVLHKISFAIIGLIVRYRSGHCELLTSLPCDAKTFKFLNLYIIYSFIAIVIVALLFCAFMYMGYCFIKGKDTDLEQAFITSKNNPSFDGLISSLSVQKKIIQKITKIGYGEYIPDIVQIKGRGTITEPLLK